PGFDVFTVPGPEVVGQGHDTVVEQVRIINDMVAEVVFGVQAQSTGLEAHVDVFGDQNDGAVRKDILHGVNDFKDDVVGLAHGQPEGKIGLERPCLEVKLATGSGIARGVQSQSPGQIGIGSTCQTIQKAADLPGVSRHFGQALFLVVQFFKDHHGQEDVVFLKLEDG